MTLQVAYEDLESRAGRQAAGRRRLRRQQRAVLRERSIWIIRPVPHRQRSGAPASRTPQFHQQMVYAVASDTISHFEFALGGPIRWRPQTRLAAGKQPLTFPERRIFPHAFQQANAFYDAKLGSRALRLFSRPPGR